MNIKKFNKNLQNLINNNTLGSNEILQLLHKHIKKNYKIFLLSPFLIDDLKEKFPAFNNIQKYLTQLHSVITTKKSISDFFEKYDYELESIYDKIYNNCKKFLLDKSNFITISNSKTVYEIFKRLKKDKSQIKIYVSESRPKNEGRILAKKLIGENIKVELIIEAMLGEYVEKSDAAIIGADIILKNGNVVNKVGSKSLAIICKYFKVPTYVLADKNKFSVNNTFNKKIMLSDEIWKISSNIQITNYYFEEIDKKLITKIFSD